MSYEFVNGPKDLFRESTILIDTKLGNKFWAEAANKAVYLKNKSATSSLGNKTPFEAWYQKKPDFSHIH